MNGAQLKEAGQQLALFNAGESWLNETLAKLQVFCADRKKTGNVLFKFEDFRALGERMGWEQPKSAKVWGALPRVACKKGLIKPTKEYVPAQSKKTHGHMVRLWQIA